MDDTTTTAITADARDTADPAKAEPMEESLESRNSEKIDLSLDEIIKLNKKEQRANKAAYKASNKARNRRASNKNTVLKKLDTIGQQQRFPLRQGQYRSQQGPYRSRYTGPPFPGFYKVKPYNIKNAGTKGVGPNRRYMNVKAAVQFGQRKPLFRGVFYQANRGLTAALRKPQSRGQMKPPFRPEQKRGGGRPFILNRAFAAMKSNEKLDKYQKVRSWKKAPSTGTTLTVSLPNSKASPEPATMVMDRSAVVRAGTSSQPKGIPLRFNLKATINQTGVTLNDRFTGMRIRPDPGHAPQRGGPRGRARGRGRGRGRTVVLQ